MFDIIVDLIKEINHIPSREVSVKLQTEEQSRAEIQFQKGQLQAKAWLLYNKEMDKNKKEYMYNLMCNGIYSFDNL